MAGIPLLPLDHVVAVAEYSRCETSRQLMTRLDFLHQEFKHGSTYSGPIGKELISSVEYLAELDKEMASLVCHGLEQRKLERRPQSFDVFIPLGLKPSSSQNKDSLSKNESSGKLNLMLKKGTKNKTILKPLGS